MANNGLYGNEVITPNANPAVADLGRLLEAAAVVLPFTGAGISTESGIPDFRSPGGLWTRHQPISFQDSWPARRCVVKLGGGVLRCMTSLSKRGRLAGTSPLQACTGMAKYRPW